MPNNTPHTMEERFDSQFGKNGPDEDSLSIGRAAGCDDCSSNIALREEHKQFCLSEIVLAVREREDKITEKIKEARKEAERLDLSGSYALGRLLALLDTPRTEGKKSI